MRSLALSLLPGPWPLLAPLLSRLLPVAQVPTSPGRRQSSAGPGVGRAPGRSPDAPLGLGLPDIRVATARQRCLDPRTKRILVHEDLVVGCTEPGPGMQNR